MTKQKRILSLAAAVIMTSTSLTATGVYASDVSHEHDCGIDSYAQELMASGEIKDYTQAPYYYALEEFLKVLGFSDNEADQGDDFFQYSRELNGEVETLTLNTDLFDSNNDYRIKRLSLPEVKELIHMTVKPALPPFADFGDESGELPF